MKIGSKLKPEPHARHMVRPPPTSGIAPKVTQPPSASHNAPVLPAFGSIASTPVKHSTKISNLDFSADGKWLRSCDGNGELLYWSLPALKPETRTHQLRYLCSGLRLPICQRSQERVKTRCKKINSQGRQVGNLFCPVMLGIERHLVAKQQGV